MSRMSMSSLRRGAVLAAAALAVLAGPARADDIVIDGRDGGRTFDGVGALSAGADGGGGGAQRGGGAVVIETP